MPYGVVGALGGNYSSSSDELVTDTQETNGRMLFFFAAIFVFLPI